MTRAAPLISERLIDNACNSWEIERIGNPYEAQMPKIAMTGRDGLRRPLWREYSARPRVL